ncbi:Synaptotagmin 1 [Folsomia candida]|uniref:Synaptotagmin 1 n=1 Tax=Folsomia candida TaxID=158441 RepID=A0A226D5Z8_FOLCA|nr:Synaptotagmin 1 [Folsomia candida]
MTAKANKMGRLNYKLEYDFKTTNLTVSIMQAADLVAMDSGGTSDPYNPTFNETFVFKNIPFGDMMAKTLMIQCFDFDRFGKHDQIGEIRLPMCQIDLAACWEGWKDLDPPDDTEESPGDVCFSLRYVPTSGKFTGKAARACLFALAHSGLFMISCFVSNALLSDLISFTRRFTFELKPEQLPNAHLILTCLDYDRIGTCDPIGKVAVGPKQEGKGLQHWMDMVNTPRRPIVQWHTLIDPDEFLKASKVS